MKRARNLNLRRGPEGHVSTRVPKLRGRQVRLGCDVCSCFLTLRHRGVMLSFARVPMVVGRGQVIGRPTYLRPLPDADHKH